MARMQALTLTVGLLLLVGCPLAAAEPLRLQGALAALARAADDPLALQAEALRRGAELRRGRVKVVVEARSAREVPALSALLAALGAEDVAAFEELLRARVPLSALRPLAAVPAVRYVRLPYAPRPASVVGRGVELIGAPAYHEAGYRGQGVRVAIIDLGFAGLDEAVANGDLPAGAVRLDYTGTGLGGIAHGTAVAEIVHDVAPEAELLLMKVADEVDLGRAVEEALRRGARVINHSVVWYNTEFGDGRGEVSQIAEQAVARGAVWVNAAGNNALQHWIGAFQDRDDDGWAEFAPQGGETLSLQADAGETIEVFLTWDAWPQTAVDYDLYLGWDENGNGQLDPQEFTVGSTDPQRGADPPTEHVILFAPGNGQYLISVSYRGALPPPAFEVFTVQHTLRTPVRAGSVLAPATAPSVLAVGAVNQAQWQQGTVREFSAQGPTRDGRLKPELLAPDGVRTFSSGRFPTQFGRDGRFVGTSASSPHVAGAAALLFSENPGMTASQLLLKLTRDARDVGPRGPDNESGYGELQLRLEPTTALELRLGELELSDAVIETGQTVALSVRVTNPHERPVSGTLALMIDGAAVAGREIVLEPGRSQTVVFTWTFHTPGTYLLGVDDLPPLRLRVVEPLAVQGASWRLRTEGRLEVTVHGAGIAAVRLALYDLAGRRVLAGRGESATLTLSLLDGQGRPLANGVYLLVLTVEGAAREAALPIGKVFVLF